MILFLLWYTFDDWLAAVTGVAWLGHVPILLAFFAECAAYILLAIPFGVARRIAP